MCEQKSFFDGLCLRCGTSLNHLISKRHRLCGMCYTNELTPYPPGFGSDFRDKYVGVTTRRPLRVRVNDMMRWEGLRHATN